MLTFHKVYSQNKLIYYYLVYFRVYLTKTGGIFSFFIIIVNLYTHLI